MHMRNLERRVHLLLDEPRYRKVAGEARRRRVSVATVIRDAIDQLPAGTDVRRRAVAEILGADPMPVPANPTDLDLDGLATPKLIPVGLSRHLVGRSA
jgi:hypothetical protein